MENDELLHYGVKGMKWGIRRYQKKDGSLTNAGKKRIKNAGALGFPAYDRKRRKWKGPVKNRLAAIDNADNTKLKQTFEQERKRIENDREILKKAGYVFTKNPNSDVREHNDDIVTRLIYESPTYKKAKVEYTKKLIDSYADATLTDLELKNTPQAKAFVKEWLENER